MSRIWIDLNDLSRWSGHDTGIQRVIYNLALQYAEDQPEVGFFVFNDPTHEFLEASFWDLKNLREAILKPKPKPQPGPTKPSTKRKAIHTLRSIIYRIPINIRRRIPREFVIATKTTLRRVADQNQKRQVKVIQSSISNGQQIQFQPDDIVLVFGSEWDNLAFMPTLLALRSKVGFKLYQVVFDLIPLLMPHLFGYALFDRFSSYMFEVGSNSDGLLAISESTKKDMQSFCQDLLIPVPQIDVFHLGDNFDTERAGQKPNIDLKGPFILSVGTVEIRKNHSLLYQAYRLANERHIDLPTLVIVGRAGWLSKDIIYAISHDPVAKGKIKILHTATDSELTWLYKNCLYTVYPALYEGWGLPIAESLAFGKACLSSDTSSMPEIAGDLIDYFSPYDAGQLLGHMERYQDQSYLESKTREVKNKYRPFDWKQSYEQVNRLILEHSKTKQDQG